jgi:hypothetical protein
MITFVIAEDEVAGAVSGFRFAFPVDDLDVHARELDRWFAPDPFFVACDPF